MRTPRVEEGQFPQPVRERRERDITRLEDARVGPELDLRARLLIGLHVADALHVADGFAAFRCVAENTAVALDLGLEALGEGVGDRDADPVEAAGDLIGLVVELAAGVEGRSE